MEIIEKYQPLNTKDSIDGLMSAIKETPGAMMKSVYMQIFQSIRKVKLQIYFQETYPEKSFNCPEIKVRKVITDETYNYNKYNESSFSSGQKKNVVQKKEAVKSEVKVYRRKRREQRDSYVYNDNLIQKPIILNPDCTLKNRTDVDYFIKVHPEWYISSKIYNFEEKSKTIEDKELRSYFNEMIEYLRQEIYRMENNKEEVIIPSKTPWRSDVKLSNERLREMGYKAPPMRHYPPGGQNGKTHH